MSAKHSFFTTFPINTDSTLVHKKKMRNLLKQFSSPLLPLNISFLSTITPKISTPPLVFCTGTSPRWRPAVQDGILLLDDQEPVTGAAPGTDKSLKLSNQTYIGSRPDSTEPGFQVHKNKIKIY